MKILCLAHLASTLFMVGVIWFVQIVHYPLFAGVGPESFPGYVADHGRRTTWVVVVPMVVELATAVLLVIRRPAWISAWQAWLGLGLVGVIWLSTFFLQVPRHEDLSGGFDPAAHRSLVITNWIRATAWSARGLLVLAMASRGP